MTVAVPGVVPPTPVRVTFVSNTSTWTYLGSRSVHTNPGASFASGLGLFAMHSLGLPQRDPDQTSRRPNLPTP